jgi:23S rRNA (cytosine1962-C5)-methyltransferase
MTISAKITLKPGKEHSVLRKHPWVFSGAIAKTEGEIHNGDTVEVVSHTDHFLAFGHAAEGSISVRIFSFSNVDLDKGFWTSKIQVAHELRLKLGLVSNESTNMYRLVHAEGDGLPGLIIDIYGKTAVIQTHSVGMHELRNLIAEILVEVVGVTSVFNKSAEKLEKNSGQRSQDEYLIGSHNPEKWLEHGAVYKIDWETGQKTGFFIDQRESRALLGQLAKGKKVLNTFCYTGGFSICALRGGATLTHSLDSSQKALDLTAENLELNGFDPTVHKTIKADAVNYFKEIEEDYDIIVLDPPAFAKHLSARHKAIQAYTRINEAAIRKIKSGGLIFTFSCSQVVDRQMFASAIMAAAIQAKRVVRILYRLQQPGDHPVNIFHPEGEYLKGLVIEVL